MEGYTSRLFAANQYIPLEHVISDMVETHWCFISWKPITFCQPVDHAGGGYRADDRSMPATFFNQIAQSQSHDFMWVDEISPSIHGSNTICIPICNQSQVPHAVTDCAGKRSQVAADGFGMDPTESWVHLSPDLLNLAACTLQDAFDHPSS